MVTVQWTEWNWNQCREAANKGKNEPQWSVHLSILTRLYPLSLPVQQIKAMSSMQYLSQDLSCFQGLHICYMCRALRFNLIFKKNAEIIQNAIIRSSGISPLIHFFSTSGDSNDPKGKPNDAYAYTGFRIGWWISSCTRTLGHVRLAILVFHPCWHVLRMGWWHLLRNYFGYIHFNKDGWYRLLNSWQIIHKTTHLNVFKS